MISKTRNIKEVFYRLNVNVEIKLDLLESAFMDILKHREPKIRDVLLGAFLTSIMTRGPTVEEVVALLNTAFKLDKYSPESAVRVNLPKGKLLISAAGSGKKGVKTINISTPSALVAASLGAYIVKPGSSSTSSVTGSADFVREVGANIDLEVGEMADVLNKTGFGFFPIEKYIPKFDKVYGGRFYAPHVLSFGLAALVNPIKFDTILYGLAHPDVEFAIKVLREFGIKNAMIVSCTHDDIHFLDEIGVYGTTKLMGMRNAAIEKVLYIQPTEILGLPRYTPKDIAQGRTKEVNIKHVLKVLNGRGARAHEDIVCINAANLLYLAQLSEDLKEGYHKAKDVIRKGQPLEKLIEFVESSNGDTGLLYKYLE
ncbi:MAG: hypothetical protein WBD99_02040 [Thermodesulfobacteriota bacterium]